MVTKEKLSSNLDELRKLMPKKPKEYTKDHPIMIKEALGKYSNRRSVNGVQACTKLFNENNFPLPFWFNPTHIRVGFFNNWYYKRWNNGFGKIAKKKRRLKGLKDFDYLWVPVINHLCYQRDFNETIIEAFDVNRKYIESRLKSNQLLESKRLIIEEIFKNYKRKHFISCISTLFPLIDFVTRKVLKTTNLGIDITKICKLFEQNGFGLDTADYLMPHITLVYAHNPEKRLSKEEFDKLYEQVKGNDFGLIGPALSSFIRFANYYYGYYKEDGTDSSEINRHAILHGSINSFGNKINVIRLMTFLYLLLELQPVLKILLNDE